MKRLAVLFVALVVALSAGISGYATFQDGGAATPGADVDPCATPDVIAEGTPSDLTDALPDATPATEPGPGDPITEGSPEAATDESDESSDEASGESLTENLPDATPATEPGPGAPITDGTPAVDPCVTPEAAADGDSAEGDAAAEVVTVDLVDIAFVPNQITIPADTDVTFRFENKGAAPHDFKIDDPEVYSGSLSGGQSSEVVVNLPAGEYTFYCTVPGHRQAGMVGTLIVE